MLDRKKPEERRGKVQLIDGSKMFVKMRKSLGSKRKELSPDDVDALVKLYGAFEDGGDKRSKVFTNEAFGDHTITVERPLRMSFQVTAERIDAALESKPVAKLADDTRQRLQRALETIDSTTVWLDRAKFDTALGKALGGADVRVGLPVRKALWAALGKRDEKAEPCTGAKGVIEPDPKLRDTENVPLDEDIEEYFAREVAPHVADAWIDHSKTKIGYEVPFTRHFYEYIPPRPLEEIDSDVKRLIAEIQVLFTDLDS